MEEGGELLFGRLVDTTSKKSYSLKDLPVTIVSDEGLEPMPCAHELLVIPPGREGEAYILHVGRGDPPLLSLVQGQCSVDGQVVSCNSQAHLPPGSLLILGSDRSLQYVLATSHTTPTPTRRKLPPTPGQSVQPAAPLKPRRQRLQPQEQHWDLHCCSPMTVTRDPGLRKHLQRIAGEVCSRLGGYEDRKPPPPYEQVGNSIGYQLLHQQQHDYITSGLIESLYPALKENVFTDSALEESYSCYLAAFQVALCEPSRPNCLLPADHPTIDFVVDTLVHLCSMPHMMDLMLSQGEMWAQLLCILSHARQNRAHLVARQYLTRLLSCMHLSIMAKQTKFQLYGWTILAKTVRTPPTTDGKPVLSEASLTMALSLVESQLETHCSDALVLSTVKFLAEVATLAKHCACSSSKSRTAGYSQNQATLILALFREKSLLRSIMKIPSELRSGAEFVPSYNALVKALVPTRGPPAAASARTTAAPGTDTSLSSSNSSLGSSGIGGRQVRAHITEGILASDESEVGSQGMPASKDLISHSSPYLLACTSVSGCDPVQKLQTQRSFSCSNLLRQDFSPCQHLSSTAADTPTTCTRPADTATTSTRPADTATTSTRPADTATTSTRPADTATICTRPTDTATTSTRPADTATTSTRPADTATTSTRPADTATTSTRPADTATICTRPTDTATTSTRPADTATTLLNELPGADNSKLLNTASRVNCWNVIIGESCPMAVSHTSQLPSGIKHGQEASITVHTCSDTPPVKESTMPPVKGSTASAGNAVPQRSQASKLVPSEQPSTQTPHLHPSCPPHSTPSQTPDLTPSKPPHSTPSQPPDLTPSKPPHSTPRPPDLTLSSPPHSTPSQSPDLTPSQFSNLAPSKSPGLTPSPFTNLNPSHSPDLTSSQFPGLTPSQSFELTPSQSFDQTPSQSFELTPSQSFDLTPSQSFDQTPSQSFELTPSQSSDLTPQFSDQTPSQSFDLTPSQLCDKSPSTSPSSFLLSPSWSASFGEELEPHPLTPSMTNLVQDVQELLDLLNTPLTPVNGGVVRVPSLPRYSRYYRHSFKKASPQQNGFSSTLAGEDREDGSSIAQKCEETTLAPLRLQWGVGVADQSLQGQEESALFEVSGKFLSFRHSVVEDVMAAHADIHSTLLGRSQLLDGVLSLWSKGKGLQAATNLLQACFSEENNDVAFFLTTLQCFLTHKSPWTLAVCVVLLPPLRQLLAAQTPPRQVLCEVVLMIVDSFSELILAHKAPTKHRLSCSVLDKEQQLVCYKELHALWTSIDERLHHHLPPETSFNLRQVHIALQPFQEG